MTAATRRRNHHPSRVVRHPPEAPVPSSTGCQMLLFRSLGPSPSEMVDLELLGEHRGDDCRHLDDRSRNALGQVQPQAVREGAYHLHALRIKRGKSA